MCACISRFICFSFLTSLCLSRLSLIIILVFPCVVCAQVLNVSGKVSTDATPVRYASITFIDQNDTTKKFSAVTDTLGNYHLDIITSVENKPIVLPSYVVLGQNYPNPFSSSTAISYQLNKQSEVSIKIYDILGREVKAFRLGVRQTGMQWLMWDGKNNVGDKIAQGVYFYRLQTGKETQVKKMIFAGGSTTFNMPHLGGYSSNIKELKKEKTTQSTGGIFTVEITNVGNTRPKILQINFPNVLVQQDTTLNFNVQLGMMAYSLCYQRWDSSTINGNWQNDWDIFLNNITGTNLKDITNWKYDDYDPAWSLDGRYIAFRRDTQYGTSNLCIYDTANDTCIVLVSDTVDYCDLPHWTPDSKKIVYYFRNIPNPQETHIINVDGSNDRKLEHTPAFFYLDSYTFLYTDSGKVYKTNIDNSFNEFVFDLKSQGSVRIRDFNPNTTEILFCASSNGINIIKTYNIETKNLRVLFAGGEDYIFPWAKWSKDFSKIAIIEDKTGVVDSTYDEYLSVLENGIKRRLVHISIHETSGGASYFGWYDPKFSPDGEYIAYGKLFAKSGQLIALYIDLYVVEVATGTTRYIDRGEAYDWNPLKPH